MVINIDDLEQYVPLYPGEQSLDALLHKIARNSEHLHEVACEPPGGSWNHWIIQHHLENCIYRWDNIPRKPPGEVKRPDHVVQLVKPNAISFLLFESKVDLGDLQSTIGTRMKSYFLGSENFTGIADRPAWHRKCANGNWEVLPPDSSDEVHYWLKKVNEIEIWTGFSFITLTESTKVIEEHLIEALGKSDIKVVLAACWQDESDSPKLLLKMDNDFRSSQIGAAFQDALVNCNLNKEIL